MDYLVSPLMGITRGYEEVFLSVTGIEDKAIKFNEKTVNDAKEFKGNLESKIDNIMSSVRRYKDDLDDDYKALMGKTDKERQASIDKEKSEKAR